MTRSISLPSWAAALGSLAITAGGVLIGVASASWQARTLFAEQTSAITSLRQTIDESVKPALSMVVAHESRLASHDMHIAVIESSCCGERGTVKTSAAAASTAVEP